MTIAMTHILYYEPDYDISFPNLWQLRGQYKYPSILSDLYKSARITILMHTIPPRTDPYRRILEEEYGVKFIVFHTTNTNCSNRGEYLAESLARVIMKLKVTVLSNLNGRSIIYCYASARAAELNGIRYVMRIGGDDLATKSHFYEKKGIAFLGTRQHFELIQYERIALEIADTVIAMTKREKARLELITTNKKKIEVCYRGVDLNVFKATIAKSGVCRRFLFVGRKSFEKGYDILESAAKQLHIEKLDINFTFAGTFEADEVENRTYLGYVNYEDLPELYKKHDALIVCSRTEGFPQVVMEAMSMGLPCIMTRHIFEKDFEDHDTALFCDNDANDLARKIRMLAGDSDLFKKLSTKALAHAQLNFSSELMCKNYQMVLLGN